MSARKRLNFKKFLDQLQGLSIEEDNELQEDEIPDNEDSDKYIPSDSEAFQWFFTSTIKR